MSKAQTDIRTTSYDANQANAAGYQGTLDDALMQVRAERQFPVTNRGHDELLMFLGVNKVSSGPPCFATLRRAMFGNSA